MSEITFVSRELTFFDMEFKESDVSANDKLQNIINKVIEGGESSSTAHMILGSIDYDNKQNLNEKYFLLYIKIFILFFIYNSINCLLDPRKFNWLLFIR